MFRKGVQFDTRVAILEEKFSVYEQMMNKMESAILTISEAYQGISKMLAIHEEKLDTSHTSDSIIAQSIKEIEAKNSIEHLRVLEKIEKIEQKLEDKDKTNKKELEDKLKTQDDKIDGLVRFRFLVGGAVLLLGFLFTQQQVKIFESLPTHTQPAIVRPSK